MARPGGRRASAGGLLAVPARVDVEFASHSDAKSTASLALSVLLLLGAAALSGFTLLWEIGPHDEGLMLQAASRIADGQWPYRDFWWNYGPGQPVLLAVPVELFGPSLLWWRLLRVALDAVVALLAYALVRRAGAPRWLALLGWLAVAGAMAFPTGPGPNPAALALVGAALLLVTSGRSAPPRGPSAGSASPGGADRARVVASGADRAREVASGADLARVVASGADPAHGAAGGAHPSHPGPDGGRPPHRRRALLAGALCGVAVAFRPEIGGAGALAVALLGGGLPALASAVGVALAALAPFFAVAPGEMLDDTVGFLGVQHLQRLPFPVSYDGGADPNKLLEFYLPLILVLATALWAGWAVLRRPRWALAAAPLLAVGVLYLLGRPDEFHLVPLSVVLAVALAVAAVPERATALRVALVGALAVIALHGVERRAGQALHPPPRADVPSPVADGVQTTPYDAAALAGLLPAIHELAPPGAPIFVAPPRFDKVSVGDPLLYVLAQRPNPTRYDVIQPGVATSAEVQREMVADLRRTRPAALVRWLDPRGRADEPNASSRSSGVTLLDDELARTYGRPERFGDYVLYRRLR